MADHVDAAHLAGVADVSAAVGLQVQAPDVNGAHFGDGGGEQVDFGADQVGVGIGVGAGHKVDGDVARLRHLGIDAGFYFAGEFGGHIFQLKVHAGGAGTHIAPGDQGAVVAPDDAAEDVQSGVGAHQQVAPLPVDDAVEGGADGRGFGAGDGMGDGMHDGAAGTGDFSNPIFGAAGRVGQNAGVAGLPAAANVESGAVEHQPAVIGYAGDDGVALGQVGVGEEKQFGHNRPRQKSLNGAKRCVIITSNRRAIIRRNSNSDVGLLKMKLSCLQENLARGLGVVGRAVASRSTLPITQNVLLRTDQGMLMLSATNLEIAITTWIGAMIEEEGAITVPHRLVADLVNSLPSDRIDLDLQGPDDEDDDSGGGSVLHLSCGRSRTHINGADAADFPPVPQVDAGLATNIDPGVLRSGIGLVAFSAASDESRPVLTGVELKLTESNLVMAAADGFRLAVFEGRLSQPVEQEIKAIVPARTMQEVHRLASEQSGPVQMTLSQERGQALFKLEHAEIVSQLLQGSFPNYEQLIPERYETRAVMELDDLKRATQSAAVFARDGSNIVRLEMMPQEEGAGGHLKVSARSEEVGDNLDELDIEQLDGEDAKIAFNVRYLQDIVNVLGRGKVAIEVTNSSSPGVFRPAESDRYVHVVMPMYVQW